MADTIVPPPVGAEPPAELHPLHTVVRFLRAVQYRKGVVVATLLAACVLGGLYYATSDPIYEAASSLLILQMGETGVDSTGVSGGRRAEDFMVTQKNTLRSEVVIKAALETLPAECRTELEGVPEDKWPDVIGGNLSVSMVRNATILNIAYRSTNPQNAAAVVRSVTGAYLAFTEKLHQNAARELYDIFNNEKVALEEQIAAKQVELTAARQNAEELEIRDGEQGTSVVNKTVLSRNEAWNVAHGRKLDAQSRLVAIDTAIRSGQDVTELALTMAEDLGGTAFLHRLGVSTTDPTANSRIREQLVQDRAALQAASQIYGPAHQKVRETAERIRVAEQLLQNQHQALYAQLRQLGNERVVQLLWLTASQQYEQAATREQMARQSYEEAKRAAISLGGAKAQLEMLQAEWDRLQNTYDVVVQRLKDINLGQKSGTFRARPLSEPKAPSQPVSPRLTVIGMLSMLLGLGAGLLIVYVQDLMDDRFRSPEELQRQLGFPILAMVRRLEPLADCGVDAVHVHVQPNAAETEAFRTLRTALALSGDGMQRLVVSSSEPGDGKTTITVNLAAAYAQSGKRTLVIDADMRRPGLTPLLDLKGQQGLSTVLRDDAPVGEAAEANLHRSAIGNLDVLPAGPRPVNPTELLAGDRFSELLSWAETRYDQILLDSPPALVSDMAIIGRLVDGVVLTVQPEKNRRRVVLRVAESFPLLGIRVAGIVINRVDPDGGKDYYNYDYAYGYSYGHDDADDHDHDYDEPPATVVRRVA